MHTLPDETVHARIRVIQAQAIVRGDFMQIVDLQIRNFKSIRALHIADIENALILVGKNDTGKTAVLEAIRAVSGDYCISMDDFWEDYPNIEIGVTLKIGNDDLIRMHENRLISQYRRYDAWYADFCRRLPSYQDGLLSFTFVANRDGRIRYSDGYQKNNTCIPMIFPKVFCVDAQRRLDVLQENLLMLQEDELLKQMRSDCCLFERAKKCNHCFSCIGLLNRKTARELNAFETEKLLEYKLYQLNLDDFSKRVNDTFRKNGGSGQILYSMGRDMEKMLFVTAEIYDEKQQKYHPVSYMGKGMRSIYMLSLLEACGRTRSGTADLILVENPEIFLHPALQRESGDILYRLSKNSQVIFSTHSPNLLSDFNSRQIRRMIQDEEGCPQICEKTDLSAVLDDLGYSASELMNVSFVFIVEGRQDKTRLPLLLKKYYSETYDADGNLHRIAIITTNSCTNIKTYANLKYMNQTYLKDDFLMIRDGDGKDGEELKRQLCRYYEDRSREDIDRLPRVTEKNVLILKYYSFENYFLNPAVMTQLGIIPSEDAFYEILLEKWKEYLYKIRSGKRLIQVIGKNLETVDDVKLHMEEIKIHVRGHNLFDIFYGRYRKEETELLKKYIELAPREDFADILDGVERFPYFENRKQTT